MIGLRTLLLILVIVISGLVIFGPLTVDASSPSIEDGTEDAEVGGNAEVTVATGGVSLPSLIGTAAAQEGSESNPDAANEGEQQSEEQEDPYEFAFSDSLRLIESEWDGKTYIATFEADRQTTITITDSGRSSSGNEVVVVDQETRTVPAGDRVEIEFSVVEDRQVSISGDGELILQGHDDSIDTTPDQDRTFSGIGLTGIVILMTIICSCLAIRQIRKTSIKRLF